MIILSDRRGRRLQISYTNGVDYDEAGRHAKTQCKVIMPEVICNNLDDALYIQSQVNKFVNNLTHDLIK